MLSASARPVREHREYNLTPGALTQCQICGFEDLQTVIDLGHQPLCAALLDQRQLQEPEIRYPLRQVWCPRCTLSQIDYVVPGHIVYGPDYPYRAGITRELVEYQDRLAADVLSDLPVPPGGLVVDIGSNDGTLLSAFARRGLRVLGVEPTNIARLANQAGVETLQAPFGPNVARQIVSSYGRARIVTATNVFAHMATLGDVLEGLDILLASDGWIVIENHYLPSILERVQFDTIYHEHLRSYSLRSLVTLLDACAFTVVHAARTSRYGGNIRVYVSRSNAATVKPSVSALLEEERRQGLHESECYARFRAESTAVKNQLVSFLVECHAKGLRVAGNSCPGRCSTLLNFAGVGPDLLPYIAEQPTSLKLGKYLPGTHIPVVDNCRLFEEQPDYVLLLAWHYAEPIAEQLRARGLRSRLVVPLPTLSVMEA